MYSFRLGKRLKFKLKKEAVDRQETMIHIQHGAIHTFTC
jgi:hypothetical protein